MDKDVFDSLIKGIKEVGKIKRGEKQPSRVLEHSSIKVKESQKSSDKTRD